VGRFFVIAAGAMDAINGSTDDSASARSLKRRYEQHRRNIEILEEQIATYAGDAPIKLHNQLADEKRALAPLRDLLSDTTALDDLGLSDRIALILARLRRVEQRQEGVKASAEDDWLNRQERQAVLDRFFVEVRIIGYGLMIFLLIVVGLLIALLARG
jgi:hypothetical protein